MKRQRAHMAQFRSRSAIMSVFRAERVAMALLRRTMAERGEPDWRPLLVARKPPMPYRRVIGTSNCPLCGQPRFNSGTWWPEAGPNNQGNWHTVCHTLHGFWMSTSTYDPRMLAERQGFVCTETGASLRIERRIDAEHFGFRSITITDVMPKVEIDHIFPLWRVRLEANAMAWPDVLRFWGPRNLAALTVEGHRIKTAREAAERAAFRTRGAA